MTLFDYLHEDPGMALVFLVVIGWALRPIPRALLFHRWRKS